MVTIVLGSPGDLHSIVDHLHFCLFNFGVFWLYPEALRCYSWLFAQKLLLASWEEPYVIPGIESRPVVCKVNVLSTVLSLWFLIDQFYHWLICPIHPSTDTHLSACPSIITLSLHTVQKDPPRKSLFKQRYRIRGSVGYNDGPSHLGPNPQIWSGNRQRPFQDVGKGLFRMVNLGVLGWELLLGTLIMTTKYCSGRGGGKERDLKTRGSNEGWLWARYRHEKWCVDNVGGEASAVVIVLETGRWHTYIHPKHFFENWMHLRMSGKIIQVSHPESNCPSQAKHIN